MHKKMMIISSEGDPEGVGRDCIFFIVTQPTKNHAAATTHLYIIKASELPVLDH